MKMITKLAVVAALASLGSSVNALPVFEVAQDPCSVETKTALYGEFYKEIKGDQAKAYEAAKKYVACPSESKDDAEVKRVQYLKDFIGKYEKAQRKTQVIGLIYDKNDFAKGFEVGRQALTDDPENLRILIAMGYAGYLATAAKNTSFNTEAIVHAKKAIQLLEAGKVDSWEPFTGKDDALSYMNYAIAVMTSSQGTPDGSAAQAQHASDALPYFIKAAQLEGKLKKHPLTYAYIAGAYENGAYAKLSAEYKSKYEGKDESAESKLALANINQVIDRMIDAYARAVALAGSDEKYKANKTAWLEGLTTWYKYRNQSETGLQDMIASVLSKPLPAEPTPITTLPAASPATTPAATSATTPAAQSTANEASEASKNTTTTAPGSANKPTTTPTPAPKPSTSPKPKSRKHHRG